MGRKSALSLQQERAALESWQGKTVKLKPKAVRMYNQPYFQEHFRKVGKNPFGIGPYLYTVGTVVRIGEVPESVVVDWGYGPDDGMHYSHLELM